MQSKENLSRKIKAGVERLGFSFCGISRLQPPLHSEIFNIWISSGMAADLEYLKGDKVLETRNHSEQVLPGGKSVIVLGLHYSPIERERGDTKEAKYGRIASYAVHEDYHEIFRKKIRKFTSWLKDESKEKTRFRILVDSSAVPEKEYAYFAGMGWIGRNSLLIHPIFGSFCLLGVIFTTLKIDPDSPLEGDICANCSACIEACPTGAINANRTVDARKCISYQTIENRGIIPVDIRKEFGNRIFGCDTCQIVCPANKLVLNKPQDSSSLQQAIPPQVNLEQALQMDQDAFEKKYEITPINRLTLDLFQRNLLLAVGNSKSENYVDILEMILKSHPSAILRAQAAWALGEIASPRSRAILSKYLKLETDKEV